MKLSILPIGKDRELPLGLLSEIGVQAGKRGLETQIVDSNKLSGKAKEFHILGACAEFHALVKSILEYYGWGAEVTLQ